MRAAACCVLMLRASDTPAAQGGPGGHGLANSRLVSTSSVVLRPVRRDDAGVPTNLDDKVEGAPP